ncbi:glycosyltransferase involved in cell wall biosynthesis [Salinibacter ruber]|nr:glycosyltransferase involved in cell wall biosynthesis [Salinibacter ruber]
MKQAYLEHHVLLTPSVEASDGNNEGGAPVTLIEAAATGMPIVSSWHCDIPDVLHHKKTGLLAEEDTEQIAGHLERLWENPTLIKKWIGRKYVIYLRIMTLKFRLGKLRMSIVNH